MLMVEFASISYFPMLYCSKWHLTRRWNLQVSAVFPEHGKMTSNQLTSLQEQSVVMKFLVTESSKFTELHQWLSCVFGKHAVEHSSVTEWCNHFHKGHESIEDNPWQGQLQSVILSESIHIVDQVILNYLWVIVCEVVIITGVMKSSADIIIRNLKKKKNNIYFTFSASPSLAYLIASIKICNFNIILQVSQAVAKTLNIPLDFIKVRPLQNNTLPNPLFTGGSTASEMCVQVCLQLLSHFCHMKYVISCL